MPEKQDSMGDELESGIDTGASLAGEAVKHGMKNLPSRRPTGNHSGGGRNHNAGNGSNVRDGGHSANETPGTADLSPANIPSGGSSPGGTGAGNPQHGKELGNQSHPSGDSSSHHGHTDAPAGSQNGEPSATSANTPDGKVPDGNLSNTGAHSKDLSGAGSPPAPDSAISSENGRPSGSQQQSNQNGENPGTGHESSPDAPNAQEGRSPPAAGSPEAIANRIPEAQGAAPGSSSGAGAGVPGAGSESPAGIAGGAGAESGAGMSAGTVGSGGASAAGSAVGGAAGASAGAPGGAAAGGSAAAGSAAGAAGSGAAAGAAAGSAVGPVGTVAGAVAGALIVPAIKLLIKIIIMVTVLIMMFSMLPSFLFDNPEALNDRVAIENTYNHFYKSIADEYEKDIISAQGKAKNKSSAYLTALKNDLNYVMEERVKLTDEDIDEIKDGIAEAYSNSSKYVHWRADTQTLKTLEEYKEAISGNINMVLSMIDQGKKNWFVQIFSYILNSVTKGWFADFTHSISSWWDGFWNDFIVAYLYEVEVTVIVTTSDSWPDGEEEYVYLDDDPDDEEDDSDEDRQHCYITITFTYDMQDKGYGFYADKKGLDQEQIDRATEMAAYLGDLFGSENDAYVPIYTIPGYYDDAKSGGSAATNIANSITELADIVSGMVYDPNGSHAFPLQGQSDYPISSHYGPRNFPPDPWHTGIDFSISGGHPVCAVADGIVLYIAQHKSGFGNHIAVYHGSNVVTLYCHLNASTPFGIFRAGDEVKAGDIIGYVGKTGLSTGNHLHFQLHEGSSLNVRNPVGFFEIFDYAKP